VGKAKEEIDEYVRTKIDEKIKEISVIYDKKDENEDTSQQTSGNEERETENELQR